VLIDWFTVAAQIINFLILVFLLKHFLYDRVVRAMDEREERIRSRLQEADQKRQDAEMQARSYDLKLQELDRQQEQILAEVKGEAEQRRKELTQEVRGEVESLRIRWQDALRREQESFLQRLRKMAGSHVYRIARRTLHDLTDADLEERVVRGFLRQLTDPSDDGPTAELKAVVGEGDPVTVRSSFPIPPDLQKEIAAEVQKHAGDRVTMNFETNPRAILGIELKGHGRKIAWSIGQYLDTLEEQARRALEGESKTPDPSQEERRGNKRAPEKREAGQSGSGDRKDSDPAGDSP
jgi:F-type H+-transporting ATPase subunit b